MYVFQVRDGARSASAVWGSGAVRRRVTTQRLLSAAAVCVAGSWLASCPTGVADPSSDQPYQPPSAVQRMATQVTLGQPCNDAEHYIFGIAASYDMLLACRQPGPAYVRDNRHLLGDVVPGGSCNIPGKEIAQSTFDGTPLLCVLNPAPTSPFDKAVWGNYQDDP